MREQQKEAEDSMFVPIPLSKERLRDAELGALLLQQRIDKEQSKREKKKVVTLMDIADELDEI
jgi:hypothetical protein